MPVSVSTTVNRTSVSVRPPEKTQKCSFRAQPSRSLTTISTLPGSKNQKAPVSAVSGIEPPRPPAPFAAAHSAVTRNLPSFRQSVCSSSVHGAVSPCVTALASLVEDERPPALRAATR